MSDRTANFVNVSFPLTKGSTALLGSELNQSQGRYEKIPLAGIGDIILEPDSISLCKTNCTSKIKNSIVFSVP
jgi:hypothetical protein